MPWWHPTEPLRAFLYTSHSPLDCVSGYAQILPEDHVIAVDGGLDKIDELGLPPRIIIGDMDSVAPELLDKYPNTPRLHFAAEKNETDTELAIAWCLEQNIFHEIIILNDLQGRFDHCLGLIQNLLLLKKQSPQVSARIESHHEQLFILDHITHFSGKQGALLSLIALGEMAEIETYSGLKYSLQGLKLYPHLSRGISNEITEDSAEIVIKSGDILAILTFQTA